MRIPLRLTMTSSAGTSVSCEPIQYQDSTDRNTTTQADIICDQEDVEMYDRDYNNTSFTNPSVEWEIANKKMPPNSAPKEEEEICFGMVSLRILNFTLNSIKG
jgi:hypothetical protein